MTDLISKPTAIPDKGTRPFLRTASPRPAASDLEAEIAQRRWPVWKSVIFLALSAVFLWGGLWMLIAQTLQLFK